MFRPLFYEFPLPHYRLFGTVSANTQYDWFEKLNYLDNIADNAGITIIYVKNAENWA